MPAKFSDVFVALKPLLARQASRFAIEQDVPDGYSLVTKVPSPFPQHKGEPMAFASVKIGKGHVSYLQGKSCFNFTAVPTEEVLVQLQKLTEAAADQWASQGFLGSI